MNQEKVGNDVQYKHYFKPVGTYRHVDVYRVVELFDVPSGAICHAVKKLLCSGQRGAKDQHKDIKEARDTLNRWLEMREEDNNAAE